MNIAVIVAAIMALLSPIEAAPACVQVVEGATYAYYQPDTHAEIVGRMVAGEELEVREIQNDWVLVMGHGVDSAWRNARMTGWVEAKDLQACQGD